MHISANICPRAMTLSSPNTMLVTILILATIGASYFSDAKDFKRPDNVLRKGQNLCIARFENNTGEPLYYTCPRPNESEKKSYCCYLDKCCDYKEFQRQTEQQFKMTQAVNYGQLTKSAIGGVLKLLLWIVLFIIALIVGCCLLMYFMCRKKKLFQGGVFSSPLPAQPPGPSPYAPPTNPYIAYQWPPETANTPAAPPAYPNNPAYPPYPPAATGGFTQPPYNPGFK